MVANGDDENTLQALEGMDFITFGLEAHNDVHGKGYAKDWRQFDVICHGRKYCRVQLSVYGKYNAMNALAACAVAEAMGIDGKTAAKALGHFTGAGRRLEYKGEYHGAKIYDDYAHHPGELHALIGAVQSMGFARVIFAFQPHTYSRTKALFRDFVEELKTVDHVVLAEIYAARESNTYNVSSHDLAAQIPGSECFDTLPEVAEYLKSVAREGDVIVTVGAGDIYKVGEMLCEK